MITPNENSLNEFLEMSEYYFNRGIKRKILAEEFLTVLSLKLFTMHDSTTVCPGITSIELGTFPKDGLGLDVFRNFMFSPYFVNSGGGGCCCQTELSAIERCICLVNIKE